MPGPGFRSSLRTRLRVSALVVTESTRGLIQRAEAAERIAIPAAPDDRLETLRSG
jgi:hypothetical protein